VADSLRLRRPSETGKPIHAEAMTTDRSALQKGTVVHKWLERIGHDAMEGWDSERLEREKPRIRQALAAEGVLPDRLDPLADEATAALVLALSDDKGRWLLGRQEDDRYEWDLTMVAEVSGQSEITSASIDRSFVEDGVRWIVDYKTGRVPFGQGEFAGLDEAAAREKYLAEKKELYQDQLQAYGELLAHLEPDRPIKLALYFPEVERGLHEWDYVADALQPAE
jgi:ATP-dependent exoDNAse (exonuclease V) beta subunit